MGTLRGLVNDLGGQVFLFLLDLGGMSLLAGRTLYYAVTPPYGVKQLVAQMDHIAVRSVSIVGVAGLFVGLVLALQTAYGLARFGAKGTVGIIVGLSMVRELGPVVTALLVGGRVGSGFTAELGSMRVTEQIDALRTLATHPIDYLVVPRLFATLIALPLLTVESICLGIGAAYLLGIYLLQIDPAYSWAHMLKYTGTADALSGIFKAMIFALILAIIGCYKGMNCREGAEGVGRATTEAVVFSSITILISNFFLTLLLNRLLSYD